MAGDAPFEAVSAAGEEQYRMTRLALSTHTGTHVDAPAHFIAGGDSVDKLSLDILMGRPVLLRYLMSDVDLSAVQCWKPCL